ncbi:hypothetical protein FCV25MIE_14603 [Fagus crenata]
MMKKKVMVAVLVLCVIISSHMESAESASPDCYDQCSTGCVQSNTRLMQRCDRKCQIKCGPDSDIDVNPN